MSKTRYGVNGHIWEPSGYDEARRYLRDMFRLPDQSDLLFHIEGYRGAISPLEFKMIWIHLSDHGSRIALVDSNSEGRNWSGLMADLIHVFPSVEAALVAESW